MDDERPCINVQCPFHNPEADLFCGGAIDGDPAIASCPEAQRSSYTSEEIEAACKGLSPEALNHVLTIQLSAFDLMVLIGNVELALGHPKNNGPSSALCKELTRKFCGVFKDAAGDGRAPLYEMWKRTFGDF